MISTLDDCATGRFDPIISDPTVDPKQASRLLFCSGKIYYELEARRAEDKRNDAAIVRVEQLYPLPRAGLEKLLGQYDAKIPVTWVQEEALNTGAWPYLTMQFGQQIFGRRLEVVARPRAATPASGSPHRHKQEQTEIISRAFGDKK